MVTPQSTPPAPRLRHQLAELRRQLQLMQSGLIVATQALKRQNAEQDRDIANVLEFDVGARLDRQITRTEDLIESLEPCAADPLPGEPGTVQRFLAS